MKIYNFAKATLRRAGLRDWRSRVMWPPEWELISHEVILQLLFSTAHSVIGCNVFLALSSSDHAYFSSVSN
jgi:hypothetical protein